MSLLLSKKQRKLLDSLDHEVILFNRIYYKFKNQHRLHLWLRHAQHLRRHLQMSLEGLLLFQEYATQTPLLTDIQPTQLRQLLHQLELSNTNLGRLEYSIETLYISMSRLLVQAFFVPLCTTIIASISRMHCLRKPLQELVQSSIMTIKYYNSTKAETKKKNKKQMPSSFVSNGDDMSFSSITSSPRLKNSPHMRHLRKRRISLPIQPQSQHLTQSQQQTPQTNDATPSTSRLDKSFNTSFRGSTGSRTPLLKRTSFVFGPTTSADMSPQTLQDYYTIEIDDDDIIMTTSTPKVSNNESKNINSGTSSNKSKSKKSTIKLSSPSQSSSPLTFENNSSATTLRNSMVTAEKKAKVLKSSTTDKKFTSEIDDIFMVLDDA